MDRLFEALRRNPDAVALAVLCLVLGLGRQNVVSASLSAFDSGRVRIQWDCVKPPVTALDDLRRRARRADSKRISLDDLPSEIPADGPTPEATAARRLALERIRETLRIEREIASGLEKLLLEVEAVE